MAVSCRIFDIGRWQIPNLSAAAIDWSGSEDAHPQPAPTAEEPCDSSSLVKFLEAAWMSIAMTCAT